MSVRCTESEDAAPPAANRPNPRTPQRALNCRTRRVGALADDWDYAAGADSDDPGQYAGSQARTWSGLPVITRWFVTDFDDASIFAARLVARPSAVDMTANTERQIVARGDLRGGARRTPTW